MVNTTGNIHSKERGSAEDVNMNILIRWLDGQGKPVMWDTFVSVLQCIQLSTLATDIENC